MRQQYEGWIDASLEMPDQGRVVWAAIPATGGMVLGYRADDEAYEFYPLGENVTFPKSSRQITGVCYWRYPEAPALPGRKPTPIAVTLPESRPAPRAGETKSQYEERCRESKEARLLRQHVEMGESMAKMAAANARLADMVVAETQCRT